MARSLITWSMRLMILRFFRGPEAFQPSAFHLAMSVLIALTTYSLLVLRSRVEFGCRLSMHPTAAARTPRWAVEEVAPSLALASSKASSAPSSGRTYQAAAESSRSPLPAHQAVKVPARQKCGFISGYFHSSSVIQSPFGQCVRADEVDVNFPKSTINAIQVANDRRPHRPMLPPSSNGDHMVNGKEAKSAPTLPHVPLRGSREVLKQ